MGTGDDFDRAVRIALLVVILGLVVLCCVGIALVLTVSGAFPRGDPS